MTTIAQLRELEENATSPLLVEQFTGQFGTFGIASGGHLTVKPLEPADAELIVALRNIAPKLLALWEAAEEQYQANESSYADDDDSYRMVGSLRNAIMSLRE